MLESTHDIGLRIGENLNPTALFLVMSRCLDNAGIKLFVVNSEVNVVPPNSTNSFDAQYFEGQDVADNRENIAEFYRSGGLQIAAAPIHAGSDAAFVALNSVLSEMPDRTPRVFAIAHSGADGFGQKSCDLFVRGPMTRDILKQQRDISDPAMSRLVTSSIIDAYRPTSQRDFPGSESARILDDAVTGTVRQSTLGGGNLQLLFVAPGKESFSKLPQHYEKSEAMVKFEKLGGIRLVVTGSSDLVDAYVNILNDSFEPLSPSRPRVFGIPTGQSEISSPVPPVLARRQRPIQGNDFVVYIVEPSISCFAHSVPRTWAPSKGHLLTSNGLASMAWAAINANGAMPRGIYSPYEGTWDGRDYTPIGTGVSDEFGLF